MFRLQNNVPNVYVDFSRDFQLLCRLYDVVNASVREEIDSMMHLTDTKFIQSNALELLQTKLGFFTSKNFSDKELRYTLSAFPIMLKNKGTKRGIKQAVNVWANINHFNGRYNVIILNKANNQDYYTITIEFLDDINLNYNVTILDEMLRYLLPTGYTVEYAIITPLNTGLYSLFSNENDKIGENEIYTNIGINANNDKDNSIIYSSQDNTDSDDFIRYAVDTERIAGQETT